jgi:hypothetical protein
MIFNQLQQKLDAVKAFEPTQTDGLLKLRDSLLNILSNSSKHWRAHRNDTMALRGP